MSKMMLAIVAMVCFMVWPVAAVAQELPASHVLKAIPAGAAELATGIKSGKVGENVVLRGRVAKADDAFVDGRAEFVLVDDGAAAGVMRETGGEQVAACPLKAENRAVVRLVDSKGAVLTYSVRDRSGLVAGAEVFVVGKIASAHSSDAPMVVDATGIFVPREGLPAGFLLIASPEPAPDVLDAKKALKKGDKVTLKGRVGGSKKPFVNERAVFTIVGRGLKACNEIPGDKCTMPWDYCCDPREEITRHSATIQVTDAKGAPLRTDIKGRWGIKELSEVVVVGTVAEVRGAAVVVSAEKMYVVKP